MQLAGINLTNGTAEGQYVVRRLATTQISGLCSALQVAKQCASAVWQADIRFRNNVSVLRNPSGLSLDIAVLDINIVTRAVQHVMSKVVGWYSRDDHMALIEEIDALDLSCITN
eukprot:3591874-Amphidinium_carterae.2